MLSSFRWPRYSMTWFPSTLIPLSFGALNNEWFLSCSIKSQRSMHRLKWTTNKPSFSDIMQHTFFFLIAVWKDLYTVYTSALLPIASKFGPQEVNRCNQLCGLCHWAPDWFLLSRNAMIFVAAIWLLRRMKACIYELRPNTSQANYFEGFWRITSQ